MTAPRVVFAVLLLGCSSSGTTNTRVACDNRTNNSSCSDFPVGTIPKDVQAQCTGTVLHTTCPTEHIVGTCSIMGATKFTTLISHYYDDGPRPHSATDAKATCDGFSGTFTTP